MYDAGNKAKRIGSGPVWNAARPAAILFYFVKILYMTIPLVNNGVAPFMTNMEWNGSYWARSHATCLQDYRDKTSLTLNPENYRKYCVFSFLTYPCQISRSCLLCQYCHRLSQNLVALMPVFHCWNKTLIGVEVLDVLKVVSIVCGPLNRKLVSLS